MTASRAGTFVVRMASARPDHGLRRVSELRHVGRSDKTPTPKATGLGAGRLREVPRLIALNPPASGGRECAVRVHAGPQEIAPQPERLARVRRVTHMWVPLPPQTSDLVTETSPAVASPAAGPPVPRASSGRSPLSGSARAVIPRRYWDPAGGAGGGGIGGFGIHTHWKAVATPSPRSTCRPCGYWMTLGCADAGPA